MSAEKPKSKKTRLRKPPQTVKQKIEAAESTNTAGKRRLKAPRPVKALGRPFARLKRWLGKEYYLPMPNNKAGRFLNKRRSFMPRYFINSWRELKQVTWPGRIETWRLTLAVFIFAIIFGISVTIVDKGLENIFKKLILE